MVSKNRIGNHSMNLLTAVATYRENNNTVSLRRERYIEQVAHAGRTTARSSLCVTASAALYMRMYAALLLMGKHIKVDIITAGISSGITETREPSAKNPSLNPRHFVPRHPPSRIWTGKMGRNGSQVHRRVEADKCLDCCSP